jgi:protein-tyrosine phosphatase
MSELSTEPEKIPGHIPQPETNEENKYIPITRVNRRIFIGSVDHVKHETDEFIKLEIDVIINCAAEIKFSDEIKSKYSIKNFPIDHDDHASLLECIDDANDFIRDNLHQKKRILLVCDDGMSRAPAILIYYMMSNKQFSYDYSLRLLSKLRSDISLHRNFEYELRTMDEF